MVKLKFRIDTPPVHLDFIRFSWATAWAMLHYSRKDIRPAEIIHEAGCENSNREGGSIRFALKFRFDRLANLCDLIRSTATVFDVLSLYRVAAFESALCNVLFLTIATWIFLQEKSRTNISNLESLSTHWISSILSSKFLFPSIFLKQTSSIYRTK